MPFLTLNYPNSFLIRKVQEGKFSEKTSLVGVLEEFITENNLNSGIPDVTILKQYYTNIVLKFYAEVYGLASQGEVRRDVFFRENSIFFFMHDFLSHIFYGHTIDVIGDQRVHEARNSLQVKYVPLEIIVKYFIHKEAFVDYLNKKGYSLSESLSKNLASFFPKYEEIVARHEESELLNVFVEALLIHINSEADLIQEINSIASVISHEQNLRRVCVYQIFDEIQQILINLFKGVLEKDSTVFRLNTAYQRMASIADMLDFTSIDLNLDQVLTLYSIDKTDYEYKRAGIEDALFSIITSLDFVSKINDRLSFFEIPVRVPYIPVHIR